MAPRFLIYPKWVKIVITKVKDLSDGKNRITLLNVGKMSDSMYLTWFMSVIGSPIVCVFPCVYGEW